MEYDAIIAAHKEIVAHLDKAAEKARGLAAQALGEAEDALAREYQHVLSALESARSHLDQVATETAAPPPPAE